MNLWPMGKHTQLSTLKGRVMSPPESGVVTHPRQSRRHPAKTLNDLDFADNIALLESSIPKALRQLTRTAASAEKLGIVISVPKTEYTTINCNPQPPLEVYP